MFFIVQAGFQILVPKEFCVAQAWTNNPFITGTNCIGVATVDIRDSNEFIDNALLGEVENVLLGKVENALHGKVGKYPF